jgi:formylglycine-generating enzyme required for sulfatase activity
VGSFVANANGVYDMRGNVWQWCEDWYDAKEQLRVLRGAAWSNGNHVFHLLASYLNGSLPDDRRDDFGFRCVVAVESSR